MRLISYTIDGHQQRLGILDEQRVWDLREAMLAVANAKDWQYFPISNFADLFATPSYASFETLRMARVLAEQQIAPHEVDKVRILAPFAKGAKMIAIGRNYAAHAKELGNEAPTEPIYFAKLASTIIAPGEAIEMPTESQRVDHEGELAVVVGKRLRKPKSMDEALAAVFGYTIANDVTARDLQKAAGAVGQPWTRAKNYDTFCPLGPVLVTADEFDPASVDVRVDVNGVVKQQGNTCDFIFSVGQLLYFVSQKVTLEAGDIILTGTPEGVSPLKNGDVVSVSISGIGTLTNPVVGN